MSGGAYESLKDEDDPTGNEEDMRMAPPYKQRPQNLRSDLSFIEQTPGPPELLPTRMLTNQSGTTIPEDSGMTQAEMSQQKARNSAHRRSSLALPPRPGFPPSLQTSSSESFTNQSTDNSHIEYQHGVQFPRASHGPGSMRSAAASPAPSEDMTNLGRPLPRSGSGAKRKKVIQEKLMQSIASGAMPMFCANCGAIETPTWRSLHVKTVHGAPEDSDTSDQDGVTMGVEIMERESETDKVKKYRIIKSMRKSRDRVEMQGYETLSVCNRKCVLIMV